MVKKLIINGDDLGISEGQNLGIIKAHQDGILTSTTCMVNMPYAEKGLELVKKYPNLKVGVHLTLTAGDPILKGGSSFTDEEGHFYNRNCYPDHQPHAKPEQLYREWKAQIEKFIELSGHKPSHLDSHHHVHLLPWHLAVTKKLAQEYDLPVRQDIPTFNTYQYVRYTEDFYDEGVNLETFENILQFEEDYVEIMCHPAFLDWHLYNMTSYDVLRTKELSLLCSQDVKDLIKKYHITLINYSQIDKK